MQMKNVNNFYGQVTQAAGKCLATNTVLGVEVGEIKSQIKSKTKEQIQSNN